MSYVNEGRTVRQYESHECGEDGYPFAWHGKCGCDVLGLDSLDNCIFGDCTDGTAIKEMIREEAQNRCERCRHPYSKGEGKWSLCDDRCTHHGEIRLIKQDGSRSMPFMTDYLPREQVEKWKYAGVEAYYRILTVHHLDEDKANCRWWNLVALCQRCHLRMQHGVVMGTPYHYEHSEWFKPYAAAFYAFKYLGEDLSREEVMARQNELLALEYQGTQGSLL